MANLTASERLARERYQELIRAAEHSRQARNAGAEPSPQRADLGRAVVIGASVAGLTAARVLSDYFGLVTVIDRDGLPGPEDFRRGLPQTRHAHTLLPHGQMILEGQFPGLVHEVLDQGAVAINASQDIAFFKEGAWHTPRPSATKISLGVSRPLLDSTLRRRVTSHPRIQIMETCEVTGLLVDETARRVTGVRLRSRLAAGSGEMHLSADLVVDASGRASHAAAWLESLGYAPPKETVVDALTGYASRVYRRPPDSDADWKMLYVRPAPPDGTRGGVIIPLERDRWHVSLMGMNGDYPPTDEEGFLDFARSLPTSRLYDAIKGAEPLTRPSGYRRTATRMRHYEKLPRYLEGFLVLGDAVYTLNPVYALGMTAAAVAGQALAHSLQSHLGRRRVRDVTGLARSFQKRLSREMARWWRLATTEDQRWPATKVTATTPLVLGSHPVAQSRLVSATPG